MKNTDELKIGIFHILYYSRKTTYLKWYNIVTFGFMIMGVVIFGIMQHPSFTVNVSSFATVAITGLSFTLALFIATAKNIFDIEELKMLLQYDRKKNTFLFYELIGPYIFTSLIWLIIGIVVVVKFSNIFSGIIVLNSILDFLILSFFIMGLFNLFDLIVSNIQDLIKKIDR